MPKKKDLIEESDDVSIIDSELYIEKIEMKNQKWYFRIMVDTTLPRSYHAYKMLLLLNEEPYLERIEDLEQQLNDSLFAQEKTTKASVTKNIKSIRKEIIDMRKMCEDIKFIAHLEELKYKDQGTQILCRIPDDVIEPLNRQKSRISKYKIILEPIYE